MRHPTQHSKGTSQSGVMLIEVMVAVLIFAFGVLGIVSLQGAALGQVSDAKYRSDAAILANQLIATMWMGNNTIPVLQSTYSTASSGAGYTTWKAKVTGALPGVASNPPLVTVDGSGIVTVTVQWLAPSAPAGSVAHKYVAVAQVPSF
jgi:type IV pilus assembly protein PilV